MWKFRYLNRLPVGHQGGPFNAGNWKVLQKPDNIDCFLFRFETFELPIKMVVCFRYNQVIWENQALNFKAPSAA